MAIKRSGVFVKSDGRKKLAKALGSIVSKDVLVGVPREEADRDIEPGDLPINNAALAYIHENGAPEVNIPARPFIHPGIKDVQPQISKEFKRIGERLLAGDTGALDTGLHRVGLIVQAAIRNRIRTGPFEPLKESTLAARRARGRTGTLPLQDTGQLRNAINYVIRDKGKK